MGRLINLMRQIQRAKVVPLDDSTPFAPPLIEVMSRITPSVLDRLSSVSYKKAEGVLEEAFTAIPGIEFYPNGERKPPDMAFNRGGDRWRIEWKSVSDYNSHFQFNDSIPKGYIYYAFFSRKEKRYIMMRGDALLHCVRRGRVERIYKTVRRLREQEKKEYGSRRKRTKDGIPPASTLVKFTPRNNLCVQNFLPFAKADGFFGLDQGMIWRPTILGERNG
jgi:hypothetical protein